MLTAFERLVALRYLRSRRREGFISVIAWFSLLGICLGVATLIVVMAVMNGFRHDLLGRILGLNGHITITAPAAGGLEAFDAAATLVRGVPGVVAVTPLVQGQAMIVAGGAVSGVLARGGRAADFLSRPLLRDALRASDLIDFDAGDGVLVGRLLADHLGLRIGDRLTLITPQGDYTPFGVVPRSLDFPVAGLFEVGMYEYDNSTVYMPLRMAQAFFNLPERVSMLEVMLGDADAAWRVADALKRTLGPGFVVAPWQRVNASFFDALQVERNVMFLILTLIIVVAAFNIVSGQVMLVADKARGIAIMRAMGASRWAILRIFFATGSAIGVIGALAGTALGVVFALNIESIRQAIQGLTGARLFQPEIYFLSKLPARLEVGEVALTAGMALLLSFLAALYPAWRAARLDPVEVLRYE